MTPKRLIIILIVLILALSGLLAYATFAVREEYDKQIKIIEQLNIADQKSRDLSILKNNITQSGDKQEIIGAVFVRNTTLVQFIENLENLGRISGVELTVNNAESGDKLRVSFHIQGSFNNLYLFSILLEKTPYLLSLDNVSVYVSNQEKGLWGGDYTITVLSYLPQ